MQAFADKVSIITGSGRGLGADYARFMASDGAAVVVTDLDAAHVEAVTAEINGHGGRALGVAADITDADSVKDLVKQTVGRFGRVDILVNNAGIWRDFKRAGVLDTDITYWNLVMSVNLTGALVCAQAVAPHLKSSGWGRIVNISSVGSWLAGSVAGVSKLALHHLTLDMAHELGAFGITVNAVAPGPIDNDATQAQVDRASFQQLIDRLAVKRPGTSADIYGAIRFLCGPDADWLTGQVISPNGGMMSRY